MSLVALLPLLLAVSGWRGQPGRFAGTGWRRAFALGTCTGMVHFGGTIYWTGAVVSTFGGLPPAVAWLCAMALAAYMSIYLAAAMAVVGPSVRALGVRGLAVAPMAWMAGELARGYVLGGFPWIPLGSATVGLLPLAQLASLVGVYGVSGFIVAYDALLLAAFTTNGRARVRAAAAAIALIAAASVWGSWRMTRAPLTREGTPVKVGLIQPNVAQTEKWNRRLADDISDRFDAMTRQAVAQGAEVVLWPESSTPYLFNEDAARADRVRGLVRETGVPLLFGTDELERGTPEHFYNSAFMLDSGGAIAAVYRKIKLVPFGEFVPLRDLLFFVKPLVEAVSDFAPGDRVTMLPMAGHMASTAICYEIVYPHLARQAVMNGAELLTTITNDGWYGESSAPYQHFALATMRAIEQGRYLARAANTGISGLVDPYGRPIVETAVFTPAVVVGEVRFLQSRTVYARIGDLAAWIALAVTAGVVVWLIATRRRRA